ncbi:MAG: ribonuclease R [Solobacterium sp.]|nr:ribonuclease R [Solobacterium sp.]
MEKLKERILKLAEGSKKGTLDRKMIQSALNITTGSDFVKFDRAMDELEEEALLFRGTNNKYRTREQMHLISGPVSISSRGTGFLDFDQEASVRIFPENLNGAMNGDTVLVRTQTTVDRYTGMASETGTVVKVLKRAKTSVLGTLRGTGKALHFVPDDALLAEKSISEVYPGDFRPVTGLRLLMHIDSYGDPMELSLERVLGHEDDPGVDILGILLDHGVDPEYPEEVMQEAQAVPQSVSEEEKEGRRNLCDEVTVTIDGDGSKDFDDAVSVAKDGDDWILKVSIADVSHYVTQDSPLDLEARKRGTSTYILDKAVGMLPHLLSNGICSLNPHEVRLTVTCEMRILKSGHTASYEVYPSYICSSERMTYSNVNKILDGNKELRVKYEHLGSLFEDLKDCADSIRRMRKEKGAIDFDSTEAVIKTDENGRAVSVEAEVRGHAEEIIEDCMIAANVCVADLMKKRELPCIYRIHEEPQAKRMKNFVQMASLLGVPFRVRGSVTPKAVQKYLRDAENLDAYPVISKQMLRCMQKAKYDPSCVGHFGLAEPEYLHFTSPIRRYPDLIVHRMLRKYIFENDYSEIGADKERVREYSEQSSIRERESQSAEFDVEDMKKAEYMLNHIGEEYDAVITSVTGNGFYAQMDNTVEGFVSTYSLPDEFCYDEHAMCLVGEYSGARYSIGQKVKIKVLGASVKAGTISFTVTGKPGRTRVPAKKKYATRSRASRKADRAGSTRGRSAGRRNLNGRKKR